MSYSLYDGGQPSRQNTGASPWSLGAYTHLFDIDTSTVLRRCLLSILPFPPIHPRLDSFLDETTEHPDLYGPFWVTSTTIFSLFVFSSLGGSISDYLAGNEHSYDFKRLTFALTVAYSYGLGCPAGLWVLMRWFKVDLGLLPLVDLYGYGMAIWIPVGAICIVPLGIVRWAVVGTATVISGAFILENVYLPISQAEKRSSRSLFMVIILLHLLLACLVKFGLF